MKQRQLPEPPRTLAPTLRRNLWWGAPSTVFSMSNLFLVLLSALFMFQLYGISTRDLLPFGTEFVRVTSQIVEKQTETLPSGGDVSVVMAPVKVNDVLLEVRGYGPMAETSEKGDSVEILVPKGRPSDARLAGYDAYPVRPQTLVTLSILFFGPGLVVAAFSWFNVRRRRRLLIAGEEIRGTQLRRIPLPRPLKDMVFARWEYDHNGQSGRFWALQKADLEKPSLLVCGGRAAVLPSLIPDLELNGDEIVNVSRGEKYGAAINWTLLALCLVSLVVFIVL
jgi:hypothetical protein